MRLDAHLLTRGPAEATRTIAARLLKEACRPLARLEQGGDGEALHDFRVALRRLRSALRALGAELRGAVGKRERRRLRKFQRRTAPARDAEVLLAWFAEERGRIEPRALPALEWLSQRLEEVRRRGYEEATGRLSPRFRKLAARLERRLEAESAPRRGAGPGPSFGRLLARLVRENAAVLEERLAAVSGPMDVEPAHRARIAAKHLRYLLEPLRGIRRADSTQAVAVLKGLQDLLGELHDAHVASEVMGASLVEAGAERGRRAHEAVRRGVEAGPGLRAALRDDLTRGLLRLDRRAVERAVAAHRRLVEEWLPPGRPLLAQATAQLVQALESGEAERAIVRRRFLLMRLPPEALRAPPLEVDIGWLHGPRLREWVSRVRSGDSVRHFRGETTREPDSSLEEEIPAQRFEELWPTTEGHRLHKRRHRLVDAGRTWLVDDLVDLERSLVEVSADRDEPLAFPQWLGPLVVREVTDERAYHDVRLAGRRRRAPARRPPAPEPAAPVAVPPEAAPPADAAEQAPVPDLALADARGGPV